MARNNSSNEKNAYNSKANNGTSTSNAAQENNNYSSSSGNGYGSSR